MRMPGAGEELSVEPLRLGRRTRRVVGGGAVLLVCLFLLNGSPRPGCGSATGTPATGASPASPWLASDDPLVRQLHFGVLDRRRARVDAPPKDVLSPDVMQTARKLGDDGGVAVYLAGGPGFVCLGVDGGGAGYGVAQQCLLDVSVANQGLSVRISSNDVPSSSTDPVGVLDNGSILVVAVPDHAQLLAPTSTQRLASYANASVLRPDEDEVLLQPPGQAPIVVARSSGTGWAGC